MSSHGLQWYSQFASPQAIQGTADWGANLFRAAMYTGEGGYLSRPEETQARLTEAVDSAIQQDMYDRANDFLQSHIDTAVTMDEMTEKFKANRGFVKACWCGDPECEGEVKYVTGGAATRCLIEDEDMISDKCIWCGKPAKHMAYWGKSY